METETETPAGQGGSIVSLWHSMASVTTLSMRTEVAERLGRVLC